MFGSLRAVHQSEVALAGGLEQGLPGFRVAFQLGKVAALELLPLRGLMVEPCAQAVTWGRFFQPSSQMEALLFRAARPKPVHEKPLSIVRRWRRIHPLGLNPAHLPLSARA